MTTDDALRRKAEALALGKDSESAEDLDALSPEAARQERVKELHCLYSIADLIEEEDSLEQIFQRVVALMPPAWLHTEIACARITVEGRHYGTANFRQTDWRRAPLILNDYAAAHPAKKGLPHGHVPLSNLLVVPMFSRGRIRAVAAVANRAADYGQEDVLQITAILGGAQAIVERTWYGGGVTGERG